MFNFDKSDIQRITAAAIGALFLTSVSVASAVGPAWATGANSPITAQTAKTRA